MKRFQNNHHIPQLREMVASGVWWFLLTGGHDCPEEGVQENKPPAMTTEAKVSCFVSQGWKEECHLGGLLLVGVPS